jgi:EAL domain-containing protein (putative c-di-GMP-specific phosphodiesterase class I)
VLLQRGCTTGQGYYLCPPLAARDLEDVLTLVGGDEGDAPTLAGDHDDR